jgi:ribonucleoside-diphosphate reductase alpha chain
MIVERKRGRWSESASRVLQERYLWRQDGKVFEDEDGMCWRVARAVADAECTWGADEAAVQATAEQFYAVMADRQFMPNSPTLMNAGKHNGQQLSACFVLPVGDSLPEIFDAIKHAAIIHKSGGGTGFGLSRLRSEGSEVATTRGVASGPVSFLRVFNAATEAVKQGGTRRGANMGVLRVDHPDILKFIDCKRPDPQTGLRDITNFNISVAATDAFMQALADCAPFELRDPHSGKVTGMLDARTVFDRICDSAWETGDPGLLFIDRANNSASNPIPDLERIEATNPCGEQWLGGYDACNLGSINLAECVVKNPEGGYEVNWQELDRVTRVTTRFLDNVIEINPLPLQQIVDTVRSNRRIGLGVMGWADLLFLLATPYDSKEALALGEKLMRFINTAAHGESQALAAARGAFPNFERSIYRDGPPMRNATLTTVAPTGTISIIADCSSGIEPVFALAFTHVVDRGKPTERKLIMSNAVFEHIAREQGFFSEKLLETVSEHGTVAGVAEVPDQWQRVFVTAHEVRPEWHIKMQAAFQRGVDNSISKTVNLPHDAKVTDIADAYLLAYAEGCKGITVFRDGCLSTGQVLNAGTKEASTEAAVGNDGSDQEDEHRALPISSTVKPRPPVVFGYTRQVRAPEGTANITLNSDESGPLEVFISVGRAGSDIAALAEALGRLISLTLRLPSTIPTEDRLGLIAAQLRGIGGSRSIGFGAERVLSLPDAVAQALSWHVQQGLGRASNDDNLIHGEARNGYGNGHAVGFATTTPTAHVLGNMCPQCGSSAAYVLEEGCKKCHGCGYSEC